MKSISQKTLAVCFVLLLTVARAAAQQPPDTGNQSEAKPIWSVVSPPPSQQPPNASNQSEAGYVLGPDDQIVIRVTDAEEISEKPVLIGTNGNITVPMIGRVKAAGLTVEQLEKELSSRLAEYMVDPQLSVTVAEFRSQPVSIFGAVTTPGVLQLRGRKNLYEILSMAGGTRDTAGSTLTVTRRRESGEIPLPGARTDPTGQFTTVELNMKEILEGKNPEVNIEIKPNDTISVSQASANMIYVVGDVQRAGAFTLGGQRAVSVLRAISQAGGPGRTAKLEKARIIRAVPGESNPTEIALNLKQILSGKAKDFEMKADDVLVVPTSSSKVFTTGFLPSALNSVVYSAMFYL